MKMLETLVPRTCALARPCTDELRTSVAPRVEAASTLREPHFIEKRDQRGDIIATAGRDAGPTMSSVGPASVPVARGTLYGC